MSEVAQRYLALRERVMQPGLSKEQSDRLHSEINTLTESEEDLFEAVYEVEVPQPGVDLLWQEDAAKQPVDRLWTVIQGDDDNLWVVAGYHYVNRLGYLVTTKPWAGDWEQFLWMKSSDEDLDDDEDEDDAAD